MHAGEVAALAAEVMAEPATSDRGGSRRVHTAIGTERESIAAVELLTLLAQLAERA